MPSTSKAYVVHDTTGTLVPGTIQRREPRPNDVVIDIWYCGICHSDLHTALNDWGKTVYPFVPGHEIVGAVAHVGRNVQSFTAGDIVGVGCMVDSCRDCKSCDRGNENWCEKRVPTYNGKDNIDGSTTYGGYSEKIVVREEFVLKIPDLLDPAEAAPLLCAGITTYSPLKYWGAGPGKRVAVAGLGGLGAMAIKLAKAMGSEVTLFSRSHSKDVGAFELGVDRVISSSDAEEMSSVHGVFDIIIDTIPVDHGLDEYLLTLAEGGSLVIVGQIGPARIDSTRSLMIGNRSLSSSFIGGVRETQEMLDFCAKHSIVCEIELVGFERIAEAYARLKKSDVKYRFVLDNKNTL